MLGTEVALLLVCLLKKNDGAIGDRLRGFSSMVLLAFFLFGEATRLTNKRRLGERECMYLLVKDMWDEVHFLLLLVVVKKNEGVRGRKGTKVSREKCKWRRKWNEKRWRRRRK